MTYLLSFAWVTLVAILLALAHVALGTLTATFALAFLYMPAPLVGALIAERIAGRALLGSFEGFHVQKRRLILTVIAVAIAIYLGDFALTVIFGNLAGLPGVGGLAVDQAALQLRLAEMLPDGAATPHLPPPVVLYAGAFVAALIAGFTVNGFFAFGEEYAWRGLFMDELRALGPLRANIIVGIAWGLWHAPLILMGFNYGQHALLGVPAMCVFTTAFAFVLWYARERTGSLLAPAILHGAFNGFAGIFVIMLSRRDSLIAAPVGLIGAAAIALVAVALAPRVRRPA